MPGPSGSVEVTFDPGNRVSWRGRVVGLTVHREAVEVPGPDPMYRTFEPGPITEVTVRFATDTLRQED